MLFEFPIVADIYISTSKLYGMLQPEESETAAVRAVFIMDPEGKVRLIMYYPLNVGRNMDEIKQQYWHFKLQMNTKRAVILKR